MERLYRQLQNYGKDGCYPFHMPGHKRNQESSPVSFPFEQDITEIDGFDNLHHPEGIIRKAQQDMAALYGVQESFYSVNGSTAALLSAISASVKKGGKMLVARNCHKAVYHGMYLRDIEPFYVFPHIDVKLGINGGISPSRIERILEEEKDIEAVLITSPTYDGIVSDIKEIAEIVHRYDIPLIVDEAHGAHFRFSEYFPLSATELGADLVIQSIHKTLPSMTQTAVLHRCSDRVDRTVIKRFMGIYQTSSPSYVLMASLDACVARLEEKGNEIFAEYTKNLEEARKRLEKCKCIQLVTPKKNADLKIYDYDCSKIILSTINSSLTGKELHDILNREFHIEVEMSAENYVLALSSVADTKEGFEKLCEAVEIIDSRELENSSCKKGTPYENICYNEKRKIMGIAEAVDAPCMRCSLQESIGKISAEIAYLYPPGIPLIVPGEQITGLFVRNVRRYMEQGLGMQGLSDESNETICVVKE